ncbi:hypothetical protein BU26DRAFT_600431 [Trematosphaeria pertusa]|uniref:Uncharacterized protein n=1 Tax=Trematosphaeria pertusa TaxID=390896 RepID=A0A6A6IWN8_9PLEO|nr:uncharacterized protein BU26DRAFT_600431 [Trematosphaeria pertusa]KAF2254804.1 hypothetical protein BU26DRAFT_600431 [Trematosphaeria pertusa]
MPSSQALIPYRPSSALLATQSPTSSGSLIPTRLFTAQTGTALATELLYRLLIELINRLLSSLQRLASSRLDAFSSFLERNSAERRAAAAAASAGSTDKANGLNITQEVGKAALKRGFVGPETVVCPMTGEALGKGGGGARAWGGPVGPPRWVRGVLEGIEEGRVGEQDIWAGNPFRN